MFHEKLQELRKSRGMTQEELSEVLDVSRQSISKYESGTAEPSFEKLRMIAVYFGVSFDYLLGNGEKASTEKIVVNERSNRIAIISKIDGAMSSYYKFKLSKTVWKKKDQPAALLIGTDSTNMLEDNLTELAWYETVEAGQKEIEAIYAAIAAGESSYELQYDVAVKKKGLLGVQVVR
ncbi:transcriptional regulator [Enterococcus florum]|uniref:Transcriptional regulator n=1 Tax=Enterococcus florum TaxID=2480627 RepID=A0A4P5PBT3_9ENTE|nr:helix-turn-helix transcriptional regulator [Enterococcus florum]GCF95665.1 transcriptional regulator [Enterococcus florum]